TQLQVWHNVLASAAPGLVLPWNALRELILDGQGGNDRLIVDRTNGNPIPSGGLIIDGGTLSLETASVPGLNGFALHLRNGATVKLASDLRLSALSISDTASLDLADHDLVVSASEQAPLQTLQQLTNWIKCARGSDGQWIGTGLSSSAAKGNNQTGLSILLNEQGGQPILTSFAGQSVDVSDVLVKYTWNGDVNLDGVLNGDDYFLVDSGFLTQAGGYQNGDLNFDGKVDGDDYFLIDSAFIAQSGVLNERAARSANG
ncbi:MAG: hypothetical protein ACM359_21385, partial [Bacillota bacterium]